MATTIWRASQPADWTLKSQSTTSRLGRFRTCRHAGNSLAGVLATPLRDDTSRSVGFLSLCDRRTAQGRSLVWQLRTTQVGRRDLSWRVLGSGKWIAPSSPRPLVTVNSASSQMTPPALFNFHLHSSPALGTAMVTTKCWGERDSKVQSELLRKTSFLRVLPLPLFSRLALRSLSFEGLTRR